MTALEIDALVRELTPLFFLGVAGVIGAVLGWAGAKSKYDQKLFAARISMKAEARNELLWEMQQSRQAPPSDGPVYRA